MRRKPFAVATLATVSILALASPFIRAQQAGGTATTPGTYKVDGVHSSAVFSISHANISTSWGRVNDPAGTLTIAEDGALALEVTLQLEKIDTANAKRDEHLRGPDFFNAAQFPEMTFKSTSAKKQDNGSYEVTGDLTIKGTTKPITVTLTKTGEAEAPQLGHRVGFDTSFTVNRVEFGVDYRPDMLGKDVKVMISIEGVKQ